MKNECWFDEESGETMWLKPIYLEDEFYAIEVTTTAGVVRIFAACSEEEAKQEIISCLEKRYRL